jgi:hypothetical protein
MMEVPEVSGKIDVKRLTKLANELRAIVTIDPELLKEIKIWIEGANRLPHLLSYEGFDVPLRVSIKCHGYFSHSALRDQWGCGGRHAEP